MDGPPDVPDVPEPADVAPGCPRGLPDCDGLEFDGCPICGEDTLNGGDVKDCRSVACTERRFAE
jgi:hypothetical protein